MQIYKLHLFPFSFLHEMCVVLSIRHGMKTWGFICLFIVLSVVLSDTDKDDLINNFISIEKIERQVGDWQSHHHSYLILIRIFMGRKFPSFQCGLQLSVRVIVCIDIGYFWIPSADDHVNSSKLWSKTWPLDLCVQLNVDIEIIKTIFISWNEFYFYKTLT